MGADSEICAFLRVGTGQQSCNEDDDCSNVEQGERLLRTPRECMGTELSGANASTTQAFAECAKRPFTPESEC